MKSENMKLDTLKNRKANQDVSISIFYSLDFDLCTFYQRR